MKKDIGTTNDNQLEMKNAIPEMKTALEGIKTGLDEAEDQISNLETKEAGNTLSEPPKIRIV